MFLSLGAIIIVMVLSVGFTGMCSFNKDTAENGPVREVDPDTFIEIESGAMNFPLHMPDMPEDWVPNSARRTSIAGEPAPAIGWVVRKDAYVQLVQTGVEAQEAVKGFDEHPREEEGSRKVGDITVTTYGSDERDVRPVMVADLGSSRLLVSGAASQEDFDAVIKATAEAPVVGKN
ncbi:hypothetical protein GCM10007338_15240 [Corynebacterium pelargi]|uniref:Uncharacterized protein n=2 Tax=Corynebacterium pelargi TaxID=1471400 RepID=A0A410W9Q8_9CORY|nr:hypothetical protein CPELA_07160 [Corynebacterium pelargi]GGG78201.1 hypothetical protein GCM10007338_15240 [Corynebacterium pelargi]